MDEQHKLQIISEDGFIDLTFPMTSFQRHPDGSQEVTAKGQHGEASVGFSVNLGALWERQNLVNSDIVLYWGQAELVSVGTESDRFLQLLDEAYGTKMGYGRMRERIPIVAVSLAGDPASMEYVPVKMKFFFESDEEERDADFFVNVDVQARSVEFHEKDTDYRRGIGLALATEPDSSLDRFPCPCCANRTLDEEPPGTWLICEMCGWEDDPVQFSDPDFSGGANSPSLNQARECYRSIGMSSPEQLDRKQQDDPARIPQ